MLTGYQGNLNIAGSAAIANGQQLSAGVSMGGFTLAGIFIPASFTGTTITFQACSTQSGTYVDVYNSLGSTLLSYAVAPNRYIAIDPKDFQGIAFLKIKSGSAEGAARTLILASKGF